jgi:glutamate carboxypeptidase
VDRIVRNDLLDAMLNDIECLVRCESPSTDLDAVAACAEVVAKVGENRLGVQAEQLVIEGRTHLRWRLGPGPGRVLVLGHHDTVWPLGTLGTHQFMIRDGALTGPGCFDMKAGLVIAFHAVAALPERTGVTILITGDEEIGSPTSRQLVESEASGCRAVLVLEPAGPDGALKIERKGISRYELHIAGRAAHAGLEPERGVNAAIEAAHQILALAALAAESDGTTVTPTVVTAGTTTNTVPAQATISVDVRMRDSTEQERIDAEMRALRPNLRHASIRVTGGPNRPALERSSSSGLLARAVHLAVENELAPIASMAVGGGSDGNFTAALGIPTLDGLGAVGGGAHADDEHVDIAALPGRVALLAALVNDQLTGASETSEITR